MDAIYLQYFPFLSYVYELLQFHVFYLAIFSFQESPEELHISQRFRFDGGTSTTINRAHQELSSQPSDNGAMSPSSSTQAILSPSPPPRENQRPTTASDFRQRRRRFIVQKNNKSVDVQVMAVQPFSKQLSTRKIIQKSTHPDD